MKASEMTIEDAIKHAEEVAQRKCDECGSQHRQLADWLKELVALRANLKKQKEINKELVDENDDLRRRLKVAEEALSDAVPHLCDRCTILDGGQNCGHDINRVDCVGGNVRRALAAIREEDVARIGEEMAKPNLCRSCANYTSDGCQICGCADYEKGGTK